MVFVTGTQTPLERVHDHRYLSIQIAVRRICNTSLVHPRCTERKSRFATVDRCRQRCKCCLITIRCGLNYHVLLLQEAVLNRTLDDNGDVVTASFMSFNIQAAQSAFATDRN